MYYAHIREDGTTQTVTEHLQGTALLCQKFASAFGEDRRGYLLGIGHDIGKNSDAFQRRLHGGPKVDHATAGALECDKIGENFSACCVIGHHGGLPNYGNRRDSAGDPTFIGRIRKAKEFGIPPYEWDGTLEASIPRPDISDSYTLSFWMRMLYSCLVDADYLDTEAFMTQRERAKYDTLPTLLERLKHYIAPWFPPKTALNEYRCQILTNCLDVAASLRGIFSLTVPTGGGKTVASLAFALKHAVENGMDRVIYVIPYTSIIEQNAKVFREILGDENVIEHHSGAQYDGDDDTEDKKLRQRLASENWDAPVIVTTAVQFFESLYSNLPSKCRKLHNIANSVIIFDEAQMIPGDQLKPCVGAIANLVSRFRATAVLCTATQPAIDDILKRFQPDVHITEICPQVEQFYEKFQRVTYQDGGKLSNEALCTRLSAEKQVLCIVNTKKMAQTIYSSLPEDGSFHLSTLLCPKDRAETLDTIRDRLKRGLVCRVVSTSLIEAGVDVDFPAVYRQIAGLDSLIQAAGRCNREGKRPREESIVTYFEGEEPVPILQQVNITAAKQALQTGLPVGGVAIMKYYFTAWRARIGDSLDKSETVSHLKNGFAGCLLPFKTVANDFRMIDDTTKTVYIPIGDGEAICKRIANGVATREDYRKAGQYCVNIYERDYQVLLLSGDIQMIDEGSALLCNPNLYDKRTGLSLKPEFGKYYFC